MGCRTLTDWLRSKQSAFRVTERTKEVGGTNRRQPRVAGAEISGVGTHVKQGQRKAKAVRERMSRAQCVKSTLVVLLPKRHKLSPWVQLAMRVHVDVSLGFSMRRFLSISTMRNSFLDEVCLCGRYMGRDVSR